MQSHDFASTYVGTPFYMSPEICAAEKYTLKSDIWSLGCIIYELCTREPPFNAKTHFQLVQKIKEGKVAPLPPIYSNELYQVIKDCLRVNPDRRPDTAALLNLPVVRLMRKEKEVVEFSKMLKAKEDALNKRIRELDHKLTTIDNDKLNMRQEIDASLRREWEVKARLEIDRLVGIEIERLQQAFEKEVQARVDAEIQRQKKAVAFNEEEQQPQQQQHDLASSASKSDYPHSSIGTGSADGEFPSTTDLTELSAESPDTSHMMKKSARTPFARAQTMFAVPHGTPMDIEMASPSPMTIASLSLSPRRNAAMKAPITHNGNIFAANQNPVGDSRWDTVREVESDSDSDDENPIPSPTRMLKSNKNPFTSKQRPTLQAQRSAPLHRLQSKQTLPSLSKTAGGITSTVSNPELQGIRAVGSSAALRDRSNSPTRRLTKIPSAANLNGTAANGNNNNNNTASGSDNSFANHMARQASYTKKDTEQSALNKAPSLTSKTNTNIRGRTLVELQQARAGGRPLSAVMSGENGSPVRAFREHAAAANRGGSSSSSSLPEPVAVWDPERDEMPSPFLVKRKPIIRT